MNELHDLLERATDRVENPDLAARALAGARRRRTTHRGVIAAGVAATMVVVVALAGQLNQGKNDSAPPVTPSPSPTPSPATPDIAQAAWNPREVDTLPLAAATIAPAIPEVIEPPSEATPLSGNPVDAVVLSVYGNKELQLLATDGSWRSVPASSGYPSADLTADGTQVVVETETGVDVWNVRTGERTTLPNPEGYSPWDYLAWEWIDNATLLLDDGGSGGWLVAISSGEATHVPYPTGSLSHVVDSAGVVVESADWGTPASLVDWAGGERRRVDMSGIGRLSSLQADSDTIVGTSYENGPFSVYVADRADLTARHVLPVRDRDANYSNGGLSVAALLDDGTVLLQVAVFGDEFGWRLVAWDPSSGELTRVARGVGSVPAAYASTVLG
jgi:hypothetical protein